MKDIRRKVSGWLVGVGGEGSRSVWCCRSVDGGWVGGKFNDAGSCWSCRDGKFHLKICTKTFAEGFDPALKGLILPFWMISYK